MNSQSSSRGADAPQTLQLARTERLSGPHADPTDLDFDAPPSDPVRLGHFHILGRIGVGGMGIVYSAYDDELDRRVAIKLLRTSIEVAAELDAPRLMREAQALARLSHPNVVQVYEIGRHQGQLFVAMEYVRGKTLQAWMREQTGPRPWRQVLEVYSAAGRGLAAAHSVGLVHRDFKPGNVMLGDDGRVRVLDFGLVSSLAPGCDGSAVVSREPTPGPLALTTPLTMTGDILGTPAYMAPEQFNGQRCDDRTDQFSFCVALFEALYGVRPHTGSTVWDALEASERGEIRPPPPGSQVPAWLHGAVIRGLSPDPATRWPSMPALLDELARDHHARLRSRLGLGLGGLGGLGLALGLWSRSAAPTPVEYCEEALAADPLATAWSEQSPHALSPAARARAEELAATWRRTQFDLCLSYRSGALPARAYRRGLECLAPYRTVITRVGEALAAGAARSDPTELPDPARVAACADGSDMLAESDRTSGSDRVEAARIGEELARAQAALILGDYGESEALANLAVADARALADGPLLAGALYHLARAREYGPRAAATTDPLAEAALLAARYDLDELAADIALRRLRIAAYGERPQDGRIWFEVLRGHLARPGQREGTHEAEAHVYLGDIARTLGDPATARAEYERSLAAYEHADAFSRTPAMIGLGRILATEGDLAGARERYEEALEIIETELGPEHPKMAPLLLNLAVSYLAEQRYESAAGPIERARAIIGADLESPLVPTTYYYAALVAESRDDFARALELAEVARRALRAPGLASGERTRRLRVLDLVGRMTYKTGDTRAALEPYLELLDVPESQRPDDAEVRARAHGNAAEIAYLGGADDLALRFVAAARPLLGRLSPPVARGLATDLALVEGPALVRSRRPAAAVLALQGALEAHTPHDAVTDPRVARLQAELRSALSAAGAPPSHETTESSHLTRSPHRRANQ